MNDPSTGDCLQETTNEEQFLSVTISLVQSAWVFPGRNGYVLISFRISYSFAEQTSNVKSGRKASERRLLTRCRRVSLGSSVPLALFGTADSEWHVLVIKRVCKSLFFHDSFFHLTNMRCVERKTIHSTDTIQEVTTEKNAYFILHLSLISTLRTTLGWWKKECHVEYKWIDDDSDFSAKKTPTKTQSRRPESFPLSMTVLWIKGFLFSQREMRK